MTDGAWEVGYAEMVLGFPDREQSEQQAAARAALYRRHLDDLSDPQWLHAVQEAILHERWFPTVAQLRDYAAQWSPLGRLTVGGTSDDPTYHVAGYLPAYRNDEQAARDREAAKRGLAAIQSAVAARLRELPPAPARTMPAPEPHVVNRDAMPDRIDELQRQAKRILAEEPL